MSKNIRKNTVTSLATGHFSDRQGAEESTAPVGLEPTTASQVTGPTAFDVIEDLSSVGKIVALRAIANGALIAAVFAAHATVVADAADDRDEEKVDQARRRMAQQAELASWATAELGTLAQSRFDQPMTLGEALDFACSTASERQPDDLPQEVLDALGVSPEQVKLIDAAEKQKAAQRSAALRESVRERREDIAAEVHSYMGTGLGDVINTLDANQHQALLRKVGQKLQARMAQLIGMRARYSAALGEAMLLSADVKTADKALVAFTRANAGELRDAA